MIRFKAILTLLICGLTFNALAQIEVSGTVMEEDSQSPIEFATVLIGTASNAALTGTTTNASGYFSVSIDQSQIDGEDFFVEISFIGFAKRRIENPTVADGKAALGNVLLETDTKVLEEVEVRSEKSQTEFKLDKRVFNVGKDLSSTGASALEVLNNVPSVNVNIEGEISLRGSSGVQILIDGKPSVVASEQGSTLGTITADMIERIEVVTNPSAKYDAEGTAGIINIVLSKNEKTGLNGSISLNTGTPHNHSVGLSINRRTKKFNLFSQLGAGFRELPRYNENNNQNLLSSTLLESDGVYFRNENFYNITLGSDYYINPRNTVTLSGNFALEIEDQPSTSNFSFIPASGVPSDVWEREETTEAVNPKYRYDLQFKREMKGEDHELLFSTLGRFFGKDQSSDFTHNIISGSPEVEDQQTRTNFKEANYTFKLDYTRPLKKGFTVETGAQYVTTNVSNDFSVSDFVDGEWVVDSGLTNIFEYDQGVLAAYGTGAYEGKKFGIKIGARVENTDLDTYLVTTDEENDQNYTNFFPSAHLSYKVSKRVQLQLGYSRRIYRPRLWDLNPFFNIRNTFNIRQGNPDLLPEFTDAYELNTIFIFEKTSLNFGIYHQYTTDVIERISTYDDGVTTTLPLNIGTNRATGFEFNFKYSPIKRLSFNGDFNWNYFDRKGSFEGQVFDFAADRYSTKVTGKVKLPADFDFELTGQYRSSFETVQGFREGFAFADLGLRKKIMGGKTILNLSVRDVFASRIEVRETTQPTFNIFDRTWSGRFITFGVSYGFGKGEAMEFSGSRRYR